jgi:hypothetical protein
MTKLFVLVLIPEALTESEATDHLLHVMELYSQNFDRFHPYRYPCLCTETDDIGNEAANQEIGDFRHLWVLYHTMSAEQRPAWEEYIKPWEELAELAAKISAEYQEPDPNCPHCGGSGLMTQTTAWGGKHDYWRTDDGLKVRLSSTNVWYVRQLPERIEELECGALITPDGMWYQARRGDWDYTDQQWQLDAHVLIQRYPDCIAIRCLYHS